MALSQTIGSDLSISDASMDRDNLSRYEAGQAPAHPKNNFSYTLINWLEDMGEVGDTSDIARFLPIKTGIWEKFKAGIDRGSMSLICGYDSNDVGQALLESAATTRDIWSFQLRLPPGNNGSPFLPAQTFYFAGIVTGRSKRIGTGSDIIRLVTPIEVVSLLIPGDTLPG